MAGIHISRVWYGEECSVGAGAVKQSPKRPGVGSATNRGKVVFWVGCWNLSCLCGYGVVGSV